MKNRFVIATALSLLIWSCGTKKSETTSAQAADSVQVFALKKESISKTLSLPAELLPWKKAEVFAKVQGYVRELKVDIGDRVRKNDVLIILDAPEVTANYAISVANLQAAKSKYRTGQDVYKRTLLASREKGAISDSELERIKNQMLTDSASYEAARAGAEANAQLKNYLVIRAAFDGVVTKRNVYPGTLVGKDQTPIIVLENLTKLRLRMAVPEVYTSALPESNIIIFSVDAQPTKKYSATLARKSNEIDEKTRTELWEFEVSNGNRELKSGMYGNASFNVKRDSPSFVVPYAAVVTTLERKFIIRVREGKTEWVDVRTGINTSDKVEVFGDLQEGDFLLTKATDEVREGQTVVVKKK
ncbi:efflux RND transporter periplasmic adaptor subunit [Dawidia soli]|uniref:Efflux RND transporter periplasmic adaptor subunit n=1 Tax=Dawidia soli TaxID=2782352 RepID=A0AAP2D9C6_9BACT|nr:efflux RND transporter periplasmic adaptor subunit [Dawidia soli]MBT1686861.1 efflux RND transporter periplasmic adaptor subunit [Dawidia soli]